MHYDKVVVVVQEAKTSKLVANLHIDNKYVTVASKPALTSDLFIQGLPFFILWPILCVIFTNHKPKKKKKNTHCNAFSNNKHKS